MLRTSISLTALAAVADAHWIFGGTQSIAQTRLDPVVDPGTIGSHVHTIAGGSAFSENYDYNTLIQSKCSTIPVQPDKSNYWTNLALSASLCLARRYPNSQSVCQAGLNESVNPLRTPLVSSFDPSLYHQDQNTHELTLMPSTFNIYYLPRAGPENEQLYAFPAGLRMLAGDTNERTYNASSFADQAISYVCLDYNNDHTNDPDWAERPDFFDHTCPDGLRAQIFFPSCWDGVNLDSADHKSHMSYPIQNYNSGSCPDSHPKHLVSIFYEMLVSVDQYSYWGNGSWVFANGDTTGRGFHGDFQNGWADLDLLQNAIDNCPNANGDVMACPPLAAAFDQPSADACTLEGSIVDEDIGLNDNITALPGCNPLWDGTGPRPTCPSTVTPGMLAAQQPLPTGWTEIGCIAEGTNGRAFAAASTTDPAMTKAMCAAFCDSKGFSLAGAEFSTECYCDNAFRNGAVNTTVDWNQCTNKCGGNPLEICGGPQRLSFMYNPNPGPAGASVPSAAPVPPSSDPAASTVASATQAPSSSASSSASSVSVTSASTSSSSTSAVPTTSVPSKSSSPAAPPPSTTSSSAATATSSGSSVPAGWTAAGCVSDNGARTLNGYSFATDELTLNSCLSTCASQGFSMAGMEYGRECYCGNTFANGGGAALAASSCNFPCAADKANTCGGNWALSLYKQGSVDIAQLPAPSQNTSTSTSTSSSGSNSSINLPRGWSAGGCALDTPQRTLNAYAFTGADMTVTNCVAACADKGFTIAGLEYSRECYCGHSFVNGGGAALPASSCNMTCPTDGNVCGGPMALSIYKTSGAASKRHVKARHFGRARGLHNTF
ncbi:putative fungistatic metabolite [Grifola frondosa]|uniref:Putative fungistatic metabolite n=1 Tax=Grifola frondosa TaxID=5627 RepID=A0A1C7LNH1_GRIFR|nr:putative fungistatic metabolite [Grifola frondosa]